MMPSKIRIKALTLVTFILVVALWFVGLSSCGGGGEAGAGSNGGGGGGNDNTFDALYAIVDTFQTLFYSNSAVILPPSSGDPFYGQDAQYSGHQPRYTDNGDGTVTDMITGLMWTSGFGFLNFSEAESGAAACTTGGWNDWLVPTIKELYSLVDFTGNQGTGAVDQQTPPSDAVPFIDTTYFDFEYPTTKNRYIDSQYISNTIYTGNIMGNNTIHFFGLNIADGRIKAYPQIGGSGDTRYYIHYVRGDNSYGENDFIDNGDHTITDNATNLMWSQLDSGDAVFSAQLTSYTNTDGSLNWQEALDFAENLTFAGHGDWRLPNAKELHSILDYTRSPEATNSPAINPLFQTATIIAEDSQADYPFYWTSTTFNPGYDAIIICFGRALGYLNGQFLDVHGAGCQRTDPKTGSPSYGSGPQGDVRRVYNYVRVVRDVD